MIPFISAFATSTSLRREIYTRIHRIEAYSLHRLPLPSLSSYIVYCGVVEHHCIPHMYIKVVSGVDSVGEVYKRFKDKLYAIINPFRKSLNE